MNILRLLVPGFFLDEGAVQLVLQSFANLYNQLTPKHQQSLRIYIVEEPTSFNSIRALSKKMLLTKAVEPISRLEIDKVKRAYKESDFFIYMSTQNQYRIITEALQYDLPLLVLETDVTKDILDISCGMLVENGADSEIIKDCTEKMEMLFFDREVCKYLKKGAIKKRRLIFGQSRITT
jgi:hypothetical protein